jgi:hypothetical protein
MNHAVDMVTGGMTYIPSFIKIISSFQKLLEGDSHTQKGDLTSILLFFQNKERKLNICSETFILSRDCGLYENTINYLRNEQDLSQTSVISPQ